MKRNLFFLLFLSIIFAFHSCSKSENLPVIENNVLVNIVWKRQYIGNMGGGLMGYETLKFLSNDDVVRTWEDLNGVTRDYRWIGKYKIDSEKIICTVNGKSIELIRKNNNTICILSESGECFVKQ